jgi:hypothetical protein
MVPRAPSPGRIDGTAPPVLILLTFSGNKIYWHARARARTRPCPRRPAPPRPRRRAECTGRPAQPPFPAFNRPIMPVRVARAAADGRALPPSPRHATPPLTRSRARVRPVRATERERGGR